MQVSLKVAYLGVLIGPEVSDEDRWSQVISNFMYRGRLLGGLGLGWQAILRLFNMVMASVLSHVGQVALLPRSFPPEFALAISRTFRLPYNRVPAWLLMNLKALHSRSEMIDIAVTNLAAMTRIALKSPIFQNLVAQIEAVSMTPGVNNELAALAAHLLQGWRETGS